MILPFFMTNFSLLGLPNISSSGFGMVLIDVPPGLLCKSDTTNSVASFFHLVMLYDGDVGL